MNLRELQTDFQRIVLDPDCASAGWVNHEAPGLSSEDRLNIYHNAYRLRLIEALMDTFAHTAIYLGEGWFEKLAAGYVQSYHSTHTNISLYGQHFPDYLADQLADDLDVAELARMDWILRRAFDGGDCIVLTLDDLQQLACATSEVRIRPVPTLTIMTQRFNTLDIWHAINQDGVPPDAIAHPEPIDILVWRKGYSPHFRSVSRFEASAIRAMIGGGDLDDVGSTLTRDYPDIDVTSEFGGLLHRWVDDEVLCKQ